MKKFAALLLALAMLFAFASCGGNEKDPTPASSEPVSSEQPSEQSEVPQDDPAVKGEGVMTHAEYMAAEDGADVVIEAYVQAKQSWWADKATLYLADKDGAYFAYNAACTQDDYAKLEKGTKVKVTGKKTSWAGEIEVAEGAAIEIEAGNFVADIFDATALLANEEELIKHQNEFVTFKGLTVAAKADGDEELAFFYNWDNSGEEGSDSDLYFDAALDDNVYTFVVEYYLCNEESDVYQAVQNLNPGDVIDVEGFLYWYNGQQAQITSLKIA